MTEEQIRYMRDRFLHWRLPEDFNPDCGIKFDADAAKRLDPRNSRYEPVGTNLFDAGQAEAMIRFMIEGMPKKQPNRMIKEDVNKVAVVLRNLLVIGFNEKSWDEITDDTRDKWKAITEATLAAAGVRFAGGE